MSVNSKLFYLKIGKEMHEQGIPRRGNNEN